MSVKIMSLVWDYFPRGGSEKLVMLAMADWCNDAGGSLHPSVTTVAKKVCVTEKQARVILHKLIDDGYLSVIGNEFGGNPGNSRQYQLNISMLTPPVEVTRTPPVSVTPNVEVTPPVEVRDPSRGGSPTPPAHGSLTTIEPSITTNKNRDAPATRLPTDWMPSIEEINFCRTERPELDARIIADSFRDFWIAKPGAAGRKLDWPATWRNWVRNQRAPYKQSTNVQDARLAVADQIFGRNRNGTHNTIIDVESIRSVESDGAIVPKALAGIR